MKKLILILLTIGFTSSAQTKPSSKYLTKLFKNSIEQNDKKRISTFSNPWVINNIDSAYYKLDTLKVYNYKNVETEFCEYIGWTFYKKNLFILNKAHHCNEPPTNSVTNKENWYEVKFVENEKKLILQFYNLEKRLSQFEVLSIQESDSKMTLILLRKK